MGNAVAAIVLIALAGAAGAAVIHLADPGSPEQRTAGLAARQAALGPIRFFQWCGVVLALVGALGFAWQQWH